MVQRKETKWEVMGWIFTVAVGTLLHFTYDWSGGNAVVAALSAVNESTWEHMKLLAVPWILWSVAEAVALRNADAPTLAARAAGLLVGLGAVPTLYYTYTGVVGEHFLWADIAVFLVAAALGTVVSRRLLKVGKPAGMLWQIVGALVLLGIGALFVWWTYNAPLLPLFQEVKIGLTGQAS